MLSVPVRTAVAPWVQPPLLVLLHHTAINQYFWAHMVPYPVFGQSQPTFWRYKCTAVWDKPASSIAAAKQQLAQVKSALPKPPKFTSTLPLAWRGQNGCILTIAKWKGRRGLNEALHKAYLSVEALLQPQRIPPQRVLEYLSEKLDWSQAQSNAATIARFEWNQHEVHAIVEFKPKGDNSSTRPFCLEWEELKHLAPPALTLAAM